MKVTFFLILFFISSHTYSSLCPVWNYYHPYFGVGISNQNLYSLQFELWHDKSSRAPEYFKHGIKLQGLTAFNSRFTYSASYLRSLWPLLDLLELFKDRKFSSSRTDFQIGIGTGYVKNLTGTHVSLKPEIGLKFYIFSRFHIKAYYVYNLPIYTLKKHDFNSQEFAPDELGISLYFDFIMKNRDFRRPTKPFPGLKDKRNPMNHFW